MILTIFSCNGGAGASTITALLSTELSLRNHSIAVIDASFNKFMDIYLGLDLKINQSFESLHAINKDSLIGSIIETSKEDINSEGLDDEVNIKPVKLFIKEERGFSKEDESILEVLSNYYDYVLIDTNGENINKSADCIIPVLTQDNGSIRSADKLLSSLDSELLKKSAFILNKYLDIDSEDLASKDDLFNIIEVDFLGHLSHRDEIRISLNKGEANNFKDHNDEMSNIIESLKDRFYLDIEEDSHYEPMDDAVMDDGVNSGMEEDGAVVPKEGEADKNIGILERLRNFFKR